jgi:4-amino-4-deoxy-L-arabinose transferase-like glycosyltransferase
MEILLIFVSFLASYLRLINREGVCSSLGSAFLKSSIYHGLVIAISTELLSINRHFNSQWVLVLWSAMALLNCILLFLPLNQYRNRFNGFQNFDPIGSFFHRQALLDQIIISGIFLILSVCLLTSLLAPPNNYDSLTYHMSRVIHWIQNQTVAHYPTNNLRQISFPPGVGYIVAHLQLLSGNDRFANCVQWFSYLGCIIGVSLIVNILGGSKAQKFSALISASVPMAIMQSTTTQTDLTVSFWLVCLAYFTFKTQKYSKSELLWSSASFGLAVLAKPTGIIFGIPLLMIQCYRLIGGYSGFCNLTSMLRGIFTTGSVVLAALILSLPNYWRNLNTFGNFLGFDAGTRVGNLGIFQTISNLLKNVALNLPIKGFWELVDISHRYIFNIDINDPALTFAGNKFQIVDYSRLLLPDEDFVGGPVPLILLFLAVWVLLFYFYARKENKLSGVLELALSTVIGFILYSTLIKWQVWGNRLLLPIFILNAPVMGYFIGYFLSKPLQWLVSIVLIIFALFYSLTPIHHPLIALPQKWTNHSQSDSILTLNREDIYHSSYGKEIKSAYVLLSNHVLDKNCKFVGLDIGDDDCEYPIWVTLMAKGIDSFKIKHVNVQNPSQKAINEFPDENVCVLFEKKGRHVMIYTQKPSATHVTSPK